MTEIEAALEPPNKIDPHTGKPLWWTSDEDAWAGFQDAMKR